MASLTDTHRLDEDVLELEAEAATPARETIASDPERNLRVGIITIMDPANYGNRLQNYALQTALERLGCEVASFHSDAYADNRVARKLGRLAGRLCLYHHEGGLKKIVDKFFLVRAKRKKIQNTADLLREKVANGDAFNARHIKIADRRVVQGSKNDFTRDYDFFVVGSDQVWNPYYREGSDIDFLRFMPKERRIAYSASFSVQSIPPFYRRRYLAGLRDMAAISVREDQGARIINDMTGREVPVTVDPTMLLSHEDWRALCTPHPDKPTNGYYLTYFIGGRPPAFDQALVKRARERGLEIVNLASALGADRTFYAASPTAFIDFIRSAEAMFTNSFHGVVFSIIFGRRFLVFDRQDTGDRSMNSRMDTLLTRFGLSSNRHDFASFTPADADRGLALDDPASLLASRDLSLAYLKQALKIV